MKHAKKLGLVATAVMALAAFTGVSSAAAAEFHASVSGTALSGVQTTQHVFTTQGNKVTCEEATFSGTAEGTSNTHQKVSPHYSGCTAFSFASATVNTAGCVYNFSSAGTVALEGCTAGHVTINVEVPFIAHCEVWVPVTGNSAINGQTYNTLGTTPSRTLEVVTNSTNIATEVKVSTGSCPLTVGSTTSTYTGKTHVTPAAGEIFFS
jgi:hypothetical protein